MSRIHQALELAKLLRHPGAVGALRSWRPFSITSFRMLGALRAQGLRPRTVIDAGANVGQFARAAAETFPEARVVAIEPVPDVAERLRDHLADCPRVRVVAAAVGSEDGTLPFYRHPDDRVSSALPTLDEVRGTKAEVIEVPVVRLDTLLADEPLEPPVLLKLDLQGYELEALRGAPETLRRVDHVLFEAVFEPAYAGEPLFEEVQRFLNDAGFRFLRPVDFLRDGRGLIVQLDALFARREGRPAA